MKILARLSSAYTTVKSHSSFTTIPSPVNKVHWLITINSVYVW